MWREGEDDHREGEGGSDRAVVVVAAKKRGALGRGRESTGIGSEATTMVWWSMACNGLHSSMRKMHLQLVSLSER